MKRIVKWLTVISIVVFIVAWGIMGIKILNNDYLITTQAYVGLISIVVFFACVMYGKFANRCPHCGKPKQFVGRYCPYCGKELN